MNTWFGIRLALVVVLTDYFLFLGVLWWMQAAPRPVEWTREYMRSPSFRVEMCAKHGAFCDLRNP